MQHVLDECAKCYECFAPSPGPRPVLLGERFQQGGKAFGGELEPDEELLGSEDGTGRWCIGPHRIDDRVRIDPEACDPVG